MLGTHFVYEGALPQFIEEGRNMESIWLVQAAGFQFQIFAD